jgi:hypothetical protein
MKIRKSRLKILIKEEYEMYLLEERIFQDAINEGIARDALVFLKDKFVDGVEKLGDIGGGNLAVQKAMKDFIFAYSSMMSFNVKNQDKFFHCVANNMATQRGWSGKAFAIVFSELREITDLIKPTGLTWKEKFDDRRDDLEANALGRDSVGDASNVSGEYPDNFSEEYKKAIDACKSTLPACAEFGYEDEKGKSVAKYDGDFTACGGYIRK